MRDAVNERTRPTPIAKDGSEAGEAVDSKWESAHGHAHAMLRYGVMSRPAPSALADPEPTDPRSLEHFHRFNRILEFERQQRDRIVRRERFIEV